MNEIITILVLSAGLICALGPKAYGQEDVAGEIIAMEKAALERWGNGDPWGFVEIADAEISYFDPSLKTRINGIEAFRTYMEPIKGKVYYDRFELLNPIVSVSGDFAVLSFNFVSYTEKDGTMKRSPGWNTTEVYVHRKEGWRILHSHWSQTLPGGSDSN